MLRRSTLPIIPASFFTMVMGLAGLATAWQTAYQVWHLPSIASESLAVIAVAVWAGLIAHYGLKWLVARDEAKRELADPVQCCLDPSRSPRFGSRRGGGSFLSLWRFCAAR